MAPNASTLTPKRCSRRPAIRAPLELPTLLCETAMFVIDVCQCLLDREGWMARKLTRRTTRQMAAARKSFRGGRPVTPKPCPRCGAPCASAVQAAAHCVGPAVRERKEAARVTAARPTRFAESVKRVYPSWRYHRSKLAVMGVGEQRNRKPA